MIKKLRVLFLILLLSGCGAYTTIKTSKSPSYQGKIYHKIMVDAQGLSVPNKLNLEWEFKNQFEKNGEVQVILASELFPPSQTFSNDQKKATALREKLDGILIVNFTGSERVKNYTPPGPIETKIVKDEKGNEKVTTYQRPGSVTETTKGYHELTLLDTDNFKPSWVGFADTTGDYKPQESLVSKAFSKMVKDGLIRKR